MLLLLASHFAAGNKTGVLRGAILRFTARERGGRRRRGACFDGGGIGGGGERGRRGPLCCETARVQTRDGRRRDRLVA